jgi:hypothetical protein
MSTVLWQHVSKLVDTLGEAVKRFVNAAGVGFAATAIAVASSVMAAAPALAHTMYAPFPTPIVIITATVCIDGVSHTYGPGPYGTTIDSVGGPC